MNNEQDSNTVPDTSSINKQNNLIEMNSQIRKIETTQNQTILTQATQSKY